MARLTWNNVEAPDFRTSLEGFKTFSQLLDNAFRGAKEGVNTFDNALDERANTAVIAAAMRERDPEAYQKALASGAFIEGIDPTRINAATYGALNNQASSLLNQATQSQNLSDVRYASGKGRAFDALGDEFQQIESLRRMGTPEANAEADQLMASLRPQLDAAGTANTMALIKGLNDSEEFGVDITGKRQEQKFAANRDKRDDVRLGYEGREQDRSDVRLGMEQGRYDWEVSDRNDQKAGQAAFLAMQGRSMDRESALSAFSSPEFANLTPGAKMYALQQLNSSWGNIYTQDQLGAAAGFSPSASGSTWAEQVGLAGSESGGNWGALNDSGYGGRLQFGDARLADAAKAGVVPKGTTGAQFSKMSKEDQIKVENWHFRDIDNQAKNLGITKYIGKTIAGVPINASSIRGMAHLGGIKGVKKFIESGGQFNPADSNGTKLSDYGTRFASGSPQAIVTGAQLRRGQEAVGKTPASALLASAANDAGVKDVVESLRKGKFAGTSQSFLKDQLDDIVRRGRTNDGRYTINYAQAGNILESALIEKNDDSGIWNYLSGNSVRVGKDGWRLNKTEIDEEITRFKSGEISRDLDKASSTEAGIKNMTAAKAELDRATLIYQNALMRAQIQPGLRAELPRLQAAMVSAEQNYSTIANKLESNNIPNQDTPAPVVKSQNWNPYTSGVPKPGQIWDSLKSLVKINQ